MASEEKKNQNLRNKAQRDKIKYDRTDGCPSINHLL